MVGGEGEGREALCGDGHSGVLQVPGYVGTWGPLYLEASVQGCHTQPVLCPLCGVPFPLPLHAPLIPPGLPLTTEALPAAEPRVCFCASRQEGLGVCTTPMSGLPGSGATAGPLDP